MRLLILGGSGMLGHQLWRSLNNKHQVWVTLRQPATNYTALKLFDLSKSIQVRDITDRDVLEKVFEKAKPEAVINCVGIIKQLNEAKDETIIHRINAEFPHHLAKQCKAMGARLIHFSTDCVFDGIKGKYSENDPADATDLYGKTKHLGEVTDRHCVTIRSSVIGHEIDSNLSLLSWFLSQHGTTIKGYTRAIYSGFTTIEMAKIVECILTQHQSLFGLWQIASEPISKFDLLKLCQAKLGWQGTIIPDESFECDRSLNGERFKDATGYQAPTWEEMITELSKVS